MDHAEVINNVNRVNFQIKQLVIKLIYIYILSMQMNIEFFKHMMIKVKEL